MANSRNLLEFSKKNFQVNKVILTDKVTCTVACLKLKICLESFNLSFILVNNPISDVGNLIFYISTTFKKNSMKWRSMRKQN